MSIVAAQHSMSLSGGPAMLPFTASHDPPMKRRTACEECRTKKLKCSGDLPACARCVRETLSCLYSVQKQMGRPKKRSRSTPEGHEFQDGREPEPSNTLPSQPCEHTSFSGGPAHDEPVYNTSFHPWLPENDNSGWDVPLETSMPGLTLDTSINSPALPTEPQQYMARDTSTQMLLDPSLMDVGAGSHPGCACLSSLYLSLNTLQQMELPLQFPFSLHSLREAMGTASSVLECEECPRRFITCIQNTSIIGTLFVSIAERFSKVLEAITSEAVRAKSANETKRFRLADLNTSTSHLHTGGVGCAAAFSINFSPDEWRAMSKKVVRAEVYGPHAASSTAGGGVHHQHNFDHDSRAGQSFSNTEHASCFYFMGIIRRMHERQESWHASPPPGDFPLDRNGQLIVDSTPCVENDHLCLKLPKYAKDLVKEFDWT